MQAKRANGSPRRKRRGLPPHKRRHGIQLTLLVVLLCSGIAWMVLLLHYEQSRGAYEELRDNVLSTPVPVIPVTQEPMAPPTWSPTGLPSASPSPTALPEIGVQVDWDALRKTNADIRAWLYCEGTNINYPVVQCDNNSRYLTKSFAGKKDSAGALFFDCGNRLSEGYENWIIYGHRRNDGSMFGSLNDFSEESYARAHPVLYLLTEEGNYRVALFSCRIVHADKSYFALWFESQAEFAAYIDEAISQSYWSPDFEVGTEHPILTLSTCSRYSHDSDPRLLLHGVLIPVA